MEHLFWSGGTHSTAVLLNTLRDGRTVHAHHIRIGAYRLRADAEAIAVQALAPRIYEQYPGAFTYSICSVDFATDAGLFVRDAVDLGIHRAKVLGFVADVIGARAYMMGCAAPVMYGNYKGVIQYPPKWTAIPRLPDALARLVCDCLAPEVHRGQKGAPDSWAACRKCDRCSHLVTVVQQIRQVRE